MSSLNKVGNRHKGYQIAKHKASGQYVRQRDRSRLSKIKRIERALLNASQTKGVRPFSKPKDNSIPQADYLKERLAFWRLR